MLQTKTWLTETDELARELDAPDLVIIDASWHMPAEGQERARRISRASIFPGAIFFDIDEIADTKSKLPHMLPPPEKFSSRMRSMGIGDGSRIVVYDSTGLFSAARVWWTFRVMGVDDVSVLERRIAEMEARGPAARTAGRPEAAPRATSRRGAMPTSCATSSDIKALLKDRSAEIVDARAAGAVCRQGARATPGLALGPYPRRA